MDAEKINDPMYSRYRLALKYLRYYVNASNGRGHGIHSPFVYDFVREVLAGQDSPAIYKPIETLRHQLYLDRALLEVDDLGARRRGKPISQRSVADLARHSAKPPRLGRLLFRIARYYQPVNVVELGSSLGLSTAYLAAGASNSDVADACIEAHPDPRQRIVTIEGAANVAEKATQNLRLLALDHVEMMQGNFDDVLPPLLDRMPPVDLAFIDGNHRLEPTMRYFDMLTFHSSDSSVLIFDDIHWSRDMEEAWKRIKEDPRAMLTIDLFFFGLVFRRKEFKTKQHFTIRF
jgi:predicted O-methyltransferase YrrM